MATTLRVLVFGATGIGKTSLCNVLTGRSRATDNGARGVTAKTHVYPSVSDGDFRIEVVDTVGLHESSYGTVPAEKAVVALVELLEKARDGFSILIHVTRASRITKDHDDDYTFFVEKMTKGSIPVILAVTGCENESPMSAWAERNKQAFDRFAYADVVSTCCASGGPMEAFFAPLRLESRERLMEAIKAYALAEPVKLYGAGTNSSFNDALTRIWNEFVTLAGLSDKYRRNVNESVYSLMKRLGVPKAIADAAVKHVPDLVEELASKAPMPGFGKIARKIAQVFLKKLITSPTAK